jgi:hypothetical protein
MNDIQGNPGIFRAADGSGSGTPRDDEPRRHGIDLGEMLEMGLESLLMHFRRRPGDPVAPDDRSRDNGTDRDHADDRD